MNKEQEETINRLEKLINIRKNKAGQIKYDNCICSTTAIETILNMLKEKDTEIEKLKQDLIIRKKDRQIDLMAEQLIGLPVNKIKQDFEKPNFKAEITIFTDKDAIKQYFERKVE